MNIEKQIEQQRGVITSTENTIKSLKERIAYKAACREGFTGLGRPSKVVIEFPDRGINILIEEPDKYKRVFEEMKDCLLMDALDLQNHVGKQEEELILQREELKVLEDQKADEFIKK